MSEIIKREIADSLYRKRMRLGYSQEEMAYYCGLSRRQYVNLECGKSLPTVCTLINIAIRCDFDFDGLVRKLITAGCTILNEDYIA